MLPPLKPGFHKWLCSGDQIFPAVLAAIDSAQKTIRLETYTYGGGPLGQRFRDALIKALQRGVKVQVLVDSFGSMSLPFGFWDPFTATGGEARWFNPVFLKRLGFRDHRKLLVCDEETAFVGGFNFSTVYEGDGVSKGWYDIGLQIVSPLAVQLAAAFDEMFARADYQHKRFTRLRPSSSKRNIPLEDGQLLLTGPGRGRNPFTRAFRGDLKHACTVQIIAAYFLPTWAIRRDLIRIARRGGKVQLLFPAKSDVLLSQLACQSLYRRLLRAGIEIYEYQPQILHAKLIMVDDAVYVGSSNLDPRSLHLNYELMIRFTGNQDLATEAHGIFNRDLTHCRQITLDAWRKSRTWWRRFRQRWAYFILVRLDPYIARWQQKRMPN